MPSVNFRLLLVTDRHQTQWRPLSTVLQQAIRAGVPAIQLRERDLPTAALLTLAREIQAMAASHTVPLILNDRVDLVMALNLSGVHLRTDSLPVSTARRLLGPDRLVGISTHSIEEVRRASLEGADYIVFGPIYETPSKRQYGPPLGLERLAEACGQSAVPIFAIGGMTCECVRDIRQAGAHGAAVIGAVLTANDVGAAVREFTRRLEM